MKKLFSRYLEKNICICYNAVRQKRYQYPWWYKTKAPESRPLRGFFPTFKQLGICRLVTVAYRLSSHLLMQWQATPAMTAIKKDIRCSMMIHLLPVTRMGGGNIRIIAYNQFSFYQFLFVPAQSCDVTTYSHHPDCREISGSPPSIRLFQSVSQSDLHK